MTANKTEQAERVIAALDAEPFDEADQRAAVADLGIDIDRLAARLGKFVADQDDVERKARYAAAAAERKRELADFHAIAAAPKRSRNEHIAEIQSYIKRLPPEQVSLHFMKYEEATDDDLARLEAIARYLTERLGRP